MSVTESDRRHIFTKLEAVIGEEAANNMMRLLPYQPHDELATRADLHALTTRLHGDMAVLRSDLGGEMADLRSELRGEMAVLRSDVGGEMAELRGELRGEMAELRADVRTEIAGLQRWAAGILAANAVAVIAALLT